ncbi:MAG: hypothetical protein EBZ48_10370, partial [Proteobacteria bacterium]|nr:hypothetical protein [Pseudomonadota bacterium]
MLPRSTIHRIIPILRKDASRALRMKVPGFPKVYYCSFLLRDIEWFNTWASSGSIYRRRSDHTRNVYADIRVGSYRYDQTTDGGLTDNDRERESVSHVTVPIDDRDYAGLRLGLWRLTEAKFREALKDYSTKESSRISTPDHQGEMPSFVKMSRKVHISYGKRQPIDEERWVRYVKKTSKWISGLTNVSTSWVEFDASQETKIFVSSEGRIIAQHLTTFSLSASLRKVTNEGATIEQEVVINCADARELPSAQKFRRMILQKHRQLLKLSRARQLHSFSGPVLLYPHPAGLLFHEAVGHRLEGSRLLSADEGQTFRGLEGKRVLNVDIDVIDTPR